MVPRRLCGPRSIEQDHIEVQGCGRFSSRQSQRKEPTFWHSGTRHGRDCERAFAVQDSRLRCDFLHLQRLRAAFHPALRLNGVADHFNLHSRRHGRRRRRPDAPTGRASCFLRAIPGLVTLRPGDANEVVEAYRYIMQLRHQPAVLALSRQPLPTLDRNKYAPASGVARGAYVLDDAPGGNPEVILIATGSEVSLAVNAHETLLAEGIRSQVMSLAFWDIF